MASSDEKISKFLSAITNYAEEQRHSILDEVEAYKKKELENVEAEVLRGAYQLIQKETAEMRNSISRELSRREMESRRELLAQRRKITDEVFDKAKAALFAYTRTDAYLSYMRSAVQEIAEKLTGENTVLYVKEEDLPLRDTLMEAYGRPCTVEVSDQITIGGVRGVNTELNLIADNSLDEKLRDQRAWFAIHSGLSVVS